MYVFKLVFTFTVLFFSVTTLFSQNDNINKEQLVNEYTINTSDSMVFLKMNYGSSVILNKQEIEKLKNKEITKIDLIYSDYPKNIDYPSITQKRIEAFYKIVPKQSKNIPINLIRQQKSTDKISAQKISHGFVIYYKSELPKQTPIVSETNNIKQENTTPSTPITEVIQNIENKTNNSTNQINTEINEIPSDKITTDSLIVSKTNNKDTLPISENYTDSITDDLLNFNFSNSDMLDDELASQDISSLLQSSRDPLYQATSFNFNGLRYRFRGYGVNETNILVNGASMNDPVSGWGLWSVWGGLNDITRYPYSIMGLGSYSLDFGGIAGATNINTRASNVRKGSRFSYAITNRNYRHRWMGTYSSGLNSKGWAFVISGSMRYAQEGYVEGTYYNSGSYFIGIEKRINKRHGINFSLMGAPTEQSLQGPAVEEIFTMLNNPYYNPFWGYQNGEKRNSRERYRHQPLALITHDYKVSEKLSLSTTFYGLTGINGTTNLNWYDAKDPRPTYYRYLPSFYNRPTDEDMIMKEMVTQNWLNDVNTRQINWDYMYFSNSKNLYTVNNANGITGNNITGNRSKYILEEYRQDPTTIGINTNFSYRTGNSSILHGGLSYKNHVTKNYKIIDDLLGGDFWLDVDQFAEQDFVDPNAAQNDLNNLNNVVLKGDKVGYDYDLHVKQWNSFINYDITFEKIDFYLALNASHTSFWRFGNMKNGRFPDNSFGKSAVNNFFNYGIKAGIIYKISGIQYITLNGVYNTDAPIVNNAYMSPRLNDLTVDGLKSIENIATDINYYFRTPKIKARLTGFYAQINNQIYSRVFYHDVYRNFVNYTMSGVNTLHIGMEASAEYNLNPSWALTAVYTKGEYTYNSRPNANIILNNSATPLAENRIVYLKNYKLGGTPQTIGSVGVRYNGAKFWFAGVNVSFFNDFFVEVNPDRRTSEALEKYVVTDPQWNEIIDQDKLEGAYLVNGFFGKSFKIGKSYLNANLSINNILNNQTIQSNGFEQLRYDSDDIQRFPSMYIYLNGFSYFAMLTYRF